MPDRNALADALSETYHIPEAGLPVRTRLGNDEDGNFLEYLMRRGGAWRKVRPTPKHPAPYTPTTPDPARLTLGEP